MTHSFMSYIIILLINSIPSHLSETVTTSLKSILISLFCVDDLHEQITGSTDPSSSLINTSPTNRNQNNSTNVTLVKIVGGVIGSIIAALILVSVILITVACISSKRASM